jgi:hypothetical protein
MVPDPGRLRLTVAVLLLARVALGSESQEPPAATAAWGRPWALVRAEYVGPYSLSVGAEVYAHTRASIGADLGFTLLGMNYSLSAHYWPRLSRGQGRRHQFLLGFGHRVSFNTSALSGGFSALLAPTLDLRYLARPWRGLGFVTGTRLGVGLLLEARDLTRGRATGSLADRVGFVTVFYLGIALGSR